MNNVIKNIFILSDGDLFNYVRDRVIELELSSDDSRHVLPVLQNGFISKNTEIKTSDFDRVGYCMEGIDYLEYVKYLRNEVKHLYYDMVSMEVCEDDGEEFALPTVRLVSIEEYNDFINGIAPPYCY